MGGGGAEHLQGSHADSKIYQCFLKSQILWQKMLNFSSDLLILISLLKSCEAASAPDCTIGSNKQLQAINGLTEIQNEKKKEEEEEN